MCIKFFVDENLGKPLVDGLRSFGYENIEHLLDHFEKGTPDIEWLKYIGENKLVLITKDGRIRKNILEKEALRKYGVVAFFLGGNEQSTKQIALQLQTVWNKMSSEAKRQLDTGVAGAFTVNARGTKITTIPLP
jgi:predicted nuclease of predicted toxin-antitoxin system